MNQRHFLCSRIWPGRGIYVEQHQGDSQLGPSKERQINRRKSYILIPYKFYVTWEPSQGNDDLVTPGSFYTGYDKSGESWEDVKGKEFALRVVKWGDLPRPLHGVPSLDPSSWRQGCSLPWGRGRAPLT